VGYASVVRVRHLGLARGVLAVAFLCAGVLVGLSPLAAAAPAGQAGPAPVKPPAEGGASLRIPPDPPPMRESGQWIFDLRYDKGDLYLLGVHRIDLPAPQLTPRAMGRFAIELLEGPTLIERVRFDFPLLGAGPPPDAGFRTQPSFETKLTSRIGVMFPATGRGTRLELWDRATDRRWELPWPPKDTRVAPGEGEATMREGGV
jgi:hypothetical protein